MSAVDWSMPIACSKLFIVASLHHKCLFFFLLLAFQSSGQVPVLRLSIDYVVFATLTRMAMFKSGITVVIVIYSMVMSEAIPSCLLELSSLFPFLDSHCQ